MQSVHGVGLPWLSHAVHARVGRRSALAADDQFLSVLVNMNDIGRPAPRSRCARPSLREVAVGVQVTVGRRGWPGGLGRLGRTVNRSPAGGGAGDSFASSSSALARSAAASAGNVVLPALARSAAIRSRGLVRHQRGAIARRRTGRIARCLRRCVRCTSGSSVDCVGRRIRNVRTNCRRCRAILRGRSMCCSWCAFLLCGES